MYLVRGNYYARERGTMAINWTHLLWLDLETTGSDLEVDQIIEVAVILTSFNGITEIDSQTHVCGLYDEDGHWLHELPEIFRLFSVNEVVQKMHEGNDLWADVCKSPMNVKVADMAISKMLRDRGVKSKKVMIAGSGVGHFDRKFVDKYMPMTSGFLAYPAFDTGAIRRALEMAGHVPEAEQKDLKSHRALDDILLHRDEWLGYLKRFSDPSL